MPDLGDVALRTTAHRWSATAPRRLREQGFPLLQRARRGPTLRVGPPPGTSRFPANPGDVHVASIADTPAWPHPRDGEPTRWLESRARERVEGRNCHLGGGRSDAGGFLRSFVLEHMRSMTSGRLRRLCRPLFGVRAVSTAARVGGRRRALPFRHNTK